MRTIAQKNAFYAFVFFTSIGFSANAQKLPTVQQAGVYAPVNIKVDGKATEWDNKFQAYNKSTAVFYTMANDANNIYLIVQATDKTIVNKILTNKLTLTLSNSTDKNAAPVTITTPASKGNKATLNNLLSSSAPPDSIVNQANKELTASFKELKVTGIKDISDPAISIYNEYGIKFSARVDNNKAYTLELAIPIKYMSHLMASDNFSYKLQLNALDLTSGNIQVRVNGVDGTAITKADGGGAPAPGSVNALLDQMRSAGGAMSEMMNETNFTGSYTLVKK